MKRKSIEFILTSLLIAGVVLAYATAEEYAGAHITETENSLLSAHAEESDGSPETEEPSNQDTEDNLEYVDETESLPEQTDSIYEEPLVLFSSLSPHEAVVYNYPELKSALADDNGITTVYFGGDIEMQGGVRINPKKANVIVDGFNPLDTAQTAPYTLTDYRSSAFTDTIYINASGTAALHVRDLNIIGKNYYGPFGVADLSELAGAAVTYERVNYNGPQLGYHRSGTIRYIDCTASIHGGNGGSANQEFSEAKHLIFEGANSIDTATSAYSVFWIPVGGTFTIADDSSLVLTSPNTSATYGVYYADGSAFKVDISIGKRAAFDATVAAVVAPDLNVTINSFTVREGGAFYLRTTKPTSGNVLRVGGALTIEKDAKFIISGYGGSSYAVLRQESGDITVGENATFHITADSAYTTLLNLAGRAFICNDPASVLLYNANRDILASASAGRVYVNAQQINLWTALSPGGLDNLPLYTWTKADKTNFLIDATVAAGGDTSAISSNYAAGDSPGTAPSTTSFSMSGARVLSFGRLDIVVAQPTTKSSSISGVTAPGATVRVSFTQEGIDYTFPDATADSAGAFNVPINIALNESTVVTVRSSWQYLTTTADAVVSGEGKLEFFVPDFMEFFITAISSSTQTVKRLHPAWKIVVSDTRGAGSKWSLYARLNSELTPNSADCPALTGALVYIDSLGNKSVMSADTEVLIMEHYSANGEEVVPVVWDENEGILLSVKPGTAFTGTVYSASISWTLVDAP